MGGGFLEERLPCRMGVADSQLKHHLITLDRLTTKLLWLHHWFHLPRFTALGINSIPLSFDQNRLTPPCTPRKHMGGVEV
jgi:hypothetical protein